MNTNEEKPMEENVLKGYEAYKLYKQGKDKWNEWAKKNEGWEVRFDWIKLKFNSLDQQQQILNDFEGFIFPGKTYFKEFIFLKEANFSNAEFKGDVDFKGVFFNEETFFRKAIFNGKANFHAATFQGETYFSDFRKTEFPSEKTIDEPECNSSDFCHAKFKGIVDFRKATFKKEVNFCNVHFQEAAYFCAAIFNGEADFYDAIFEKDAGFTRPMSEKNVNSSITTTFKKYVDFCKTTFNERADFSHAEFQKNANFCGTIFEKTACFRKSIFKWAYFKKVTSEKDYIHLTDSKSADPYTYFKGDVTFEGAKFEKASFSNARFKGKTDFREVIFGYKTGDENSFRGARFLGEADFSKATFIVRTSFKKAWFLDKISFRKAKFDADCRLKDANFLSKTNSPNFYNATFEKLLIIDGSYFERVPDFRMAIFKTGISMLDISVKYQGNILGKAIDKVDSARYREPKKLAGEAKDHEREQMFFAYELKAKRFYETKGWKLIPNFLYGWFSNYGQSVIRPFISLFFVWGAFTLIYIYKDLLPEKISPLLFSASQIVPFMGSSKIFTRNLINPTNLSDGVYFFAFVENILGLVLIFLIVLALRNRFKLKT